MNGKRRPMGTDVDRQQVSIRAPSGPVSVRHLSVNSGHSVMLHHCCDQPNLSLDAEAALAYHDETLSAPARVSHICSCAGPSSVQ